MRYYGVKGQNNLQGWIEIDHDLENSTTVPLKYTTGSPILIVAICMRKIHQNTKGKRRINFSSLCYTLMKVL